MDARVAKGRNVKDILDKLSPENRKIADSLRKLVKDTVPEAVETVKWGNVVWLIDGESFAWILVYKDHSNLGFFRGAELKSDMLEGTGKGIRHVKIWHGEKADFKALSKLIKEARKLY